MNDVEQIIRINGYIQRKLGTLTYGGKEILCVALDRSCTFLDPDAEEINSVSTSADCWLISG